MLKICRSIAMFLGLFTVSLSALAEPTQSLPPSELIPYIFKTSIAVNNTKDLKAGKLWYCSVNEDQIMFIRNFIVRFESFNDLYTLYTKPSKDLGDGADRSYGWPTVVPIERVSDLDGEILGSDTFPKMPEAYIKKADKFSLRIRKAGKDNLLLHWSIDSKRSNDDVFFEGGYEATMYCLPATKKLKSEIFWD
ncbi:MAG: hypothetical protein V4596_10620 [Bdellovibrionota bacterium]